jgi:hypothetical protein
MDPEQLELVERARRLAAWVELALANGMPGDLEAAVLAAEALAAALERELARQAGRHGELRL